MKQRDGQFTGARGLSLYFRYWEPEEQARAVILLVHGAGEHCARYQRLAEYFCDRGYVIAGLDHIGHGKSDGQYGFVERFDDHLESLEHYRQQVERDFPGLPMILLGHSMGGLISSLFLLQHQQQFIGCALSGPAIKTDLQPPAIQILLIRLLSRFAPRLGVLQLDAAGVSRDQSVVDDYCADPLVHHGKMSARMVSEMFAGMNRIQEQAAKITLPLLLLHGGEDAMTAPSGSQFLHDGVSSQEKSLKIYPGLYHEIFNEPEQQQVFADLLAWCEERLAAA
jgi:acylglycerol lipase